MSEVSLHQFRKIRMYGAWIFVAILAFTAKSTNTGFWISIPFVVIGELIRIWSGGYIRKSKELAISGPYAFVRNPLYVGNFFIGLGFCVVIWNPLIAIVYGAGFFAVYWVTIRGEEQKLSELFGSEYQDYLKNVPRFLPRFTLYHKTSDSKFSFQRSKEHGEHITILAMVCLYILLYMRQAVFQEGVSFTSPDLTYVYLFAVGCGVCLLAAMVSRYLLKKPQ